jgi:hypothetical protein
LSNCRVAHVFRLKAPLHHRFGCRRLPTAMPASAGAARCCRNSGAEGCDELFNSHGRRLVRSSRRRRRADSHPRHAPPQNERGRCTPAAETRTGSIRYTTAFRGGRLQRYKRPFGGHPSHRRPVHGRSRTLLLTVRAEHPRGPFISPTLSIFHSAQSRVVLISCRRGRSGNALPSCGLPPARRPSP